MADKGKQQAAAFDWRWLAPRFWPTWLGLGCSALLQWLPAPWRHTLGRVLGRRLLGGSDKRCAIIRTNLQWCLPELSGQHERIIERYLGYAGQTMLDFGFFWWAGRRRFQTQIDIEGEALLQSQLEQGRRVMLITPHMLPIDFGGMALSARYPMVSFANRARNPLMNRFMTRGRTRFGLELFSRDGGLRPIIRGMKAGKILYIMVDEDLGPRDSVFAPFFGIDKATLTSTARMAAMTEAVVMPCVTYFNAQTGRYAFRIMAPLENFPSGDAVQDATQINRALERVIRLAPEQYMWSLRIFQTFRDGSPPPYTMKGKPGSGPRPRPASVVKRER